MTNVILFRAQPFHNGHLHMIKKAYEDSVRNNNRLFIFIGSADKNGTIRNPLPIEFRLDLIKNSLKDEFKDNYVFNPNTNIIPIDDLSDEANNTYTWGIYLYNKIKEYTKDEYITFYYSDKPEIVLSWFDAELREYISFRFLNRVKGLSATEIRSAIKLDLDEFIKLETPKYVYENKEKIKEYLLAAK